MNKKIIGCRIKIVQNFTFLLQTKEQVYLQTFDAQKKPKVYYRIYA